MGLIVRHAVAADDIRIGDLLIEAFVKAYAEKMPEVIVHDERKKELRDIESKRRQGAILVAELDGKIIGTVTLFKPGTPANEAWIPGAANIKHLATDVRQHGKGFSRGLLEMTEVIAFQDWKVPAICLHVRRGATGVARLYQKHGYVREVAGDFEKPMVCLEAYILRSKV